MKGEAFLKILNNFIGHKIGLYTNNESFVEGHLIDVKNDHFVIQVGLVVFYFSINNLYAISKNAKHAKPKAKMIPYEDKPFLNDIINGFKYRWVTINSSSNRIFTGLLTRNTGDYVLLINKDEQYFIQKSILTSIAEGVVEQVFDHKKSIETTSSKRELVENNKNESKVTPTIEVIDSTLEKKDLQAVTSPKNVEIDQTSVAEGAVEQTFAYKKLTDMLTNLKRELVENNKNESKITPTIEIIDSTLERNVPQEVTSQKNAEVDQTGIAEGVVKQAFDQKKSIELPTIFKRKMVENNKNESKITSATEIIDSKIEGGSQAVASQRNAEVEKKIKFIDLLKHVHSATIWASPLIKENGYQHPDLKMNTNKEECYFTPNDSHQILKKHNQQESTPRRINTKIIEGNCEKKQYPKEQKQLFGIQYLAVLFILLIIICSTSAINTHVFYG